MIQHLIFEQEQLLHLPLSISLPYFFLIGNKVLSRICNDMKENQREAKGNLMHLERILSSSSPPLHNLCYQKVLLMNIQTNIWKELNTVEAVRVSLVFLMILQYFIFIFVRRVYVFLILYITAR
jgi:hypothetical protein